MKILDENIPENQRQLLRSWGIRVRQIGFEAGRADMQDVEIISLLHGLEKSTFFTRDLGFYRSRLRHSQYGLICLAVSQYEAASFIRRFLRHPAFRTEAGRSGKVIQVNPRGIALWRLHANVEERIGW